mmetsp:Transcript_15234/g.37367  ORF Transcript_15234/g.37367 Transcript_15234/m.37367 type:complete len:286 (-) Transcript_15234:2411-3268(-)
MKPGLKSSSVRSASMPSSTPPLLRKTIPFDRPEAVPLRFASESSKETVGKASIPVFVTRQRLRMVSRAWRGRLRRNRSSGVARWAFFTPSSLHPWRKSVQLSRAAEEASCASEWHVVGHPRTNRAWQRADPVAASSRNFRPFGTSSTWETVASQFAAWLQTASTTFLVFESIAYRASTPFLSSTPVAARFCLTRSLAIRDIASAWIANTALRFWRRSSRNFHRATALTTAIDRTTFFCTRWDRIPFTISSERSFFGLRREVTKSCWSLLKKAFVSPSTNWERLNL